MKRQAQLLFVFISIIMMISLYYVTKPINENVPIAYSSYELDLEEKNNENISVLSNMSKIISSNSTTDNKKNALISIEEKKQAMEMETLGQTTLLELGYKTIFTIDNQTIYIKIYELEPSIDTVNQVLANSIPIFGTSYAYEVSFWLK